MNAMSPSVARTAVAVPNLCRSTNFRARYAALGGPASTGSCAQVALDVRRELRWRSVAPRAVLLERLHDDPVELARELAPQSGAGPRVAASRPPTDCSAPSWRSRRARPGRLDLADDPPDSVEARLAERARLERQRRRPAARRASRPARRRRCGCRRPRPSSSACSGLMYSGVPISCPSSVYSVSSVSDCAGRLGHAEVDDLGHRAPVLRSRPGRSTGLRSRWMIPFWCACWTPSQTCEEQLEPLDGGQRVAVAVLGDRHARDVAPSRSTGGPSSVAPASKHLGRCRVVHQRQGLALGLEARDDLLACPCPA